MHGRLTIFKILFICSVAITCSAWRAAAEPREDAGGDKWWKGNIHTHSLWSDGNDFPEMIADWYRQQEYHFLALSDHNVLSEGTRWMPLAEIEKRGGTAALAKYRERFGDDWVETRTAPDGSGEEVQLKPLQEFRKLVEEPGRFLMIQAEEISDSSEGFPVHLNATNISEVIAPAGGRTVSETIDNNLRAVEEHARSTGREVLAHLNHPNFGLAVTAEDMAMVSRERFFEVYNGHPGVKHEGDHDHPSVERLWDIANTIRIGQLRTAPLFGLGTDDSHHYHETKGSRPGRGWIMVRAAKLEAETLVRAVKAGDFYASSGVTLRDVRYAPESRTLEIDVEAEEGVQYTTQFIGTRVGYDQASQPRLDKDGEPLRATRTYSDEIGKVLAMVEGATAAFELTGDELYVRAVVTSSKPHVDPSFEGQLQQAWTQPVGWVETPADEAAELKASGG
jgi:hypothetical protein